VEKLSISIDEACAITGIGRTKFYAELQKGTLKAVKIGRRTLILKSSIEEWLNNLESYPVRDKEKCNAQRR